MKRIALIHDLSGFGKCSLTAAMPVISVMGMQACPLPTAILSSQTGFEEFYCDDYTDRMNRITDHWKKLEVDFDGIYSGYLGSPKQIENVCWFLENFKKEGTIFLEDPVMGDGGRCIKAFSEELLDTMKMLTRKAEVITPNLTELCLLSGKDYREISEHQNENDFLDRIKEAGEEVRRKAEVDQTIVVTGIIRKVQQDWKEGWKEGWKEDWKIGNLILSESEHVYLESPYTKKSYSGTGDLFASVVMGALMQGKSIFDAVKLAMEFLQPAIEEATADKIECNHGVPFEKYLYKLIEK